ncbi:MAG: DUF2069 domain-containing protein [Natronospirillum sp.]|uniref:DUF2069 domain-containing protein n=1 Tax=Natronospirillum sp. TaxID=2812955 RepID=UPI0025FE4F01|nr:DUF2069 domain-containing protein [Natronospirillum sp.]MCH8553167.1 DUF2069 domain-containing protein [Natronospirillum sp.]
MPEPSNTWTLKMRAEKWQHATWISYWLVMVTFAINTTANAPSDMALGPVVTAGMTFWLLQTLPLWLFFPPMKRRNVKGLSWFSYLVLLYIPFCIVGAFQPPHWSGVLATLAILLLFFCNAFWVRALKRLRDA